MTFSRAEIPLIRLNCWKMKPKVERRISVRKRSGITELEDAVERTVLGPGFTRNESVIVSNARHKELLDRARRSMVSVRRGFKEARPAELIMVDLKDAVRRIASIVGRSVDEDVLERIFGQFCIGK